MAVEKLQSFFAGVITGIKPDLLPPFASPQGQNAVIDRIAEQQGRVRRRKGASPYSCAPLSGEPNVLGIFHYPGRDTDLVLVVADDGSLQIEGDTVFPVTASMVISDPVYATQEVTFEATASTAAPCALISTIDWDFGDGNTAEGSSATHTYEAAATYTVTLTVRDTAGVQTVVTQEIVVMLQNLYEFSYTLTDTQTKALASGYVILPAPGAGKIWSVVQLDIVVNAAAGAYTNITDGAYLELSHLSSDNLIEDSSIGYTQLTDLFGTASVNFGCMKGHYSTEADSTFAALTGYGASRKVIKGVDADDNAAVLLQLTGNTGDLTGGNVANVTKIRVLAMKIDL